MLICSTDRPWGIHPVLRSDEDCPRCGWTAPGPRGDALADARATTAQEADALASELSWWTDRGGEQALAA